MIRTAVIVIAMRRPIWPLECRKRAPNCRKNTLPPSASMMNCCAGAPKSSSGLRATPRGGPAVNPDDEKRDHILRFLYERHKTTRGIQKIPIGIRDLQREMKARFSMKQPEVASNLDYLVQVGWVRKVTKERSFKTGKGMEISAEQVK